MLTVVRFHPLEVHLPTKMLAIYLAHICHEERIFFSGLARVDINFLDTICQSFLDRPFGVMNTIFGIKAFDQ